MVTHESGGAVSRPERRRAWQGVAGLVLACLLGGAPAGAADEDVPVVVVGPGASVPASCWLRTKSARESQTTRVVRGYATVGPPTERTEVLVYGARDETGRPLPWAPSRAVLEPDAKRLQVRLRPGVLIRGRVVDGTGAAVARAAVAAHFKWSSAEGEPAAAATTDAEGAFALVGLGEEEYVIRARRAATDIASAWAQVVGGARRVLLTLPETMDVTLTIVDWRDQPVPGVRLGLYEVYDRAGDRQHVAWTRTDARGHARWGQLGVAATYDLQVDAPVDRDDLAELEIQPWKPVGGRLQIPRGYTISGTVRDAKGRAVRANVVRYESGGGWRSTPTHVDGSFRLGAVPYGPTVLEAFPPGLTPDALEPTGSAHRIEATPEHPDVTLILRPEDAPQPGAAGHPPSGTTPLIVRILAPDGKPIRDAVVSFTSEVFATSSRAVGGSVEMATRGAAGRIRVFRAKNGEGDALPLAPAERDVDAMEREITVHLEPGHAIEGRVLDEGGAPITGVLVETATGSFHDLGPDAEARTGDDGTFRLVGLGSTDYRLRVPSPPSPWAMPPEIAARGGSKGLVFRLRRGEVPTLVVLDFEGRPVVGATVVLYEVKLKGSSVRSFQEKPRFQSGAKGDVVLPASDPTRPLYLSIEPPMDRDDLMGHSGRLGLPGPWNPKSGPIRLARGFTVTGSVRDAAGKGIAASIWREMTPEKRDGNGYAAALAGESGPDGTFRIRGLPYGPVRLWAVPLHVGLGFPPTSHSPDDLTSTPRGAKLVTPEKPTVELTIASD